MLLQIEFYEIFARLVIAVMSFCLGYYCHQELERKWHKNNLTKEQYIKYLESRL